MTLPAGVVIGFLLALFQIISHKSEVFSLKAKLRRTQIELDSLRNESIEDDFDIVYHAYIPSLFFVTIRSDFLPTD